MLCKFAPLLRRCEAKLSKDGLLLMVPVRRDTLPARRRQPVRAGKSAPPAPAPFPPSFFRSSRGSGAAAGSDPLGEESLCASGSRLRARVSSPPPGTSRSPYAERTWRKAPCFSGLTPSVPRPQLLTTGVRSSRGNLWHALSSPVPRATCHRVHNLECGPPI